MKIGLPKIRLSRKMLLISAGILALLGGSCAAALYVGAADVLIKSEPKDNPVGGACDTVQTMVLKTPAQRLWMRKFIRMSHADGDERIKTALRVAGLLANANSVDLVQVSVLDASGPTLRSEMRGRAIGAEVVIALKPQYLPDMKEPFIVRYFEGMPSDDGLYYGDRVSLELPEIRKLVGAMRDVPDKQDCTELPRPDDKAGEEGRKLNDHVVSEGEAPSGHEAKPAEEEEKASDHEAPAGEDEHAPTDAAPAKEQSFLDGMLSLVGLGAPVEKPAAAPADHAVEPEKKDGKHAEAEPQTEVTESMPD